MSEGLSRDELDRSFAHGVGQRMRELRKRAGRSQEEVAEALGYGLSSVSAWERGSREPRLRALADVARLLGCTVGDFFPTPELGWDEPVADPTPVRIQRLERQLATLRRDYYADRDQLVADGILSER